MPLGEPPEPAALAALPAERLVGRVLHRVYRAGRSSPWWFASVGDDPEVAGRFDLPSPDGACYLASTALGAVLEAFSDFGRGVLPAAELAARRRAEVTVPAGAPRAARLTAARARGLGVTQALWAGAPRTLTQRWARVLRRAGWLAVWTGTGHDPTGRSRSTTLFDEAGEHPPYGGLWPFRSESLADDPLVAAGLANYGIRVIADIDPPFEP